MAQQKGFTDLVRGQVAAIQASAAGLVDFTVGSILRAVVEAQSQVFLWLQGLILTLLATTRAATSVGAALNTWMADFALTRLLAMFATGNVTFSRLTSTAQGQVAVGTLVETTDGSQQYAVVADPTNGAYNAGLNAYVLPPSTASVTVPVLAQTAGAAGNAATGAVNTIVNAVPGIDTVTNSGPFGGGEDQESDAALRARFILYLASLAKATLAAVQYAINSVQTGLTNSITENYDYNGTPDRGHFSVIVDDGSGSPPTNLLNAVGSAIDLVRPITVTFEVHGPTVTSVNIAMTIVVAAGFVSGEVTASVEAALNAYVNSLGIGAGLDYTRPAQIAYDSSPGVAKVDTGYTVNGGTSDIAGTAQVVLRAGAISVTT